MLIAMRMTFLQVNLRVSESRSCHFLVMRMRCLRKFLFVGPCCIYIYIFLFLYYMQASSYRPCSFLILTWSYPLKFTFWKASLHGCLSLIVCHLCGLSVWNKFRINKFPFCVVIFNCVTFKQNNQYIMFYHLLLSLFLRYAIHCGWLLSSLLLLQDEPLDIENDAYLMSKYKLSKKVYKSNFHVYYHTCESP